MIKAITLDQNFDTDITSLSLPSCQIRYAFMRSWEGRSLNENSQDSLCMEVDRDILCFALCDGVSMSFMGDLAAKFLGQKLVIGLPGLINFKNGQREFEKNLTKYLKELVPQATILISDHQLPADLSPVFASVLAQKRKSGSESMFVCGFLDFRNDHLALAWMGDSRLRLWSQTGEQTVNLLGKAFLTTERWSSRSGLIGRLHTYQGALSSINKIMAYSDGLAVVDGPREKAIPDPALREVIRRLGETPNSDDISFLEISRGKAPA